MYVRIHMLEEEIAHIQAYNKAIAALILECKEILGDQTADQQPGSGAVCSSCHHHVDLPGVGEDMKLPKDKCELINGEWVVTLNGCALSLERAKETLELMGLYPGEARSYLIEIGWEGIKPLPLKED